MITKEQKIEISELFNKIYNSPESKRKRAQIRLAVKQRENIKISAPKYFPGAVLKENNTGDVYEVAAVYRTRRTPKEWTYILDEIDENRPYYANFLEEKTKYQGNCMSYEIFKDKQEAEQATGFANRYKGPSVICIQQGNIPKRFTLLKEGVKPPTLPKLPKKETVREEAARRGISIKQVRRERNK
jgi:hypothetical protein